MGFCGSSRPLARAAPAPLLLLLLLLGGGGGGAGGGAGWALEVEAAARVRAFEGEAAVVLRCWFRSSSPLTDKLTIDWTFRPVGGGAPEPIFHYQSGAYPATEGTFGGRVSWAGDVARHDASIAISGPRMEDNGTFSCSVKNPPDVQHNLPETLLTVWQGPGASLQLTLAGLLSVLVFLPSAVVAALLLLRTAKKSGLLNSGKKFAYKKSSIEVADEPERPGCAARLAGRCVQCMDTDDEDPD